MTTNLSLAMPPFVLDYSTAVDPPLQCALTEIDSTIRAKHGIRPEQTAIGLLDLKQGRLAWLHPDQEFYGASVPKIGILLAWFNVHPEAITNLNPEVRHELGLMIKVSSNEMAAKYSQMMGLRQIQAVLNSYGFYDPQHGGGIWVGKHYGVTGERIGDPIADNSHAATVRQLLRFCLLMEQGKLISPPASAVMRQIFVSPDIPHVQDKFLKGLAGRPVQVLRKSGEWEDWFHDVAIVIGPNRYYILAALTKNPKGENYLADVAGEVDDLMVGKEKRATE